VRSTVVRETPFSAAAERNKEPILAVLQAALPDEGSVLEIASGTGQHVCFFAQAMPRVRWQPSDPDDASREAMTLRIAEAGLANIAAPLALDVSAPHWPVTGLYDAILCINMIHISPWAATHALLRGAASHLSAGGKLILYGPYLENGTAAQSNLDFDASLKRRNPEWGLRELEEITRLAATHGLQRRDVARMPANNLTLVFARAG
jgi:cyclopropane fatty-acyl-phospholipid synthase-like methyltransferase